MAGIDGPRPAGRLSNFYIAILCDWRDGLAGAEKGAGLPFEGEFEAWQRDDFIKNFEIRDDADDNGDDNGDARLTSWKMYYHEQCDKRPYLSTLGAPFDRGDCLRTLGRCLKPLCRREAGDEGESQRLTLVIELKAIDAAAKEAEKQAVTDDLDADLSKRSVADLDALIALAHAVGANPASALAAKEALKQAVMADLTDLSKCSVADLEALIERAYASGVDPQVAITAKGPDCTSLRPPRARARTRAPDARAPSREISASAADAAASAVCCNAGRVQ